MLPAACRATRNPGTEYDFVVDEPRAVPSVKTSFLNGVTEFTHFEALNGRVDPAVRTWVEGPLVSFERFELSESRTTPTVKTTLEDTVTSFEHFDPAKSAIDPCWKAVVVEGAGAGGADSTTVTVHDLLIDFSVIIAGRSWRLRDGALVETRV